MGIADPANDLFGPDPAADPLAHYSPADRNADIFLTAADHTAQVWRRSAAELVSGAQGNLGALRRYIDRQTEDLGIAFRITGDEEERPWALNPMPLILSSDEWQHIEAGLAQRADLLEAVIADIYGPQRLVADGHLPAAVISGSAHFARRMVGTKPPDNRHLNVCAFDLARGPDGEWRVLMDRVRLPVGIGYALENRLALMRSTGGLALKLGARQHEAFCEALRRGLAAACHRADPRLALLTPGRFNQTYPEQAYLARHLGLSLVEGRDLAVRHGKLYARTIAGLKRIDGLWRWINARDLDPLHFDSRSKIGVPDLIAAGENGLVLANWPGVGVIETRAMPAFLPRLSREVTGQDLLLPNVATWWCGGKKERDYTLANFDNLVLSSAFREEVAGLPEGRTRIGGEFGPQDREAIRAGIARRPMDYAAQEIVRLSTTPSLQGDHFEARSFTLRAYLARDADGSWVAMPGGFARISQNGQLRSSLMELEDDSLDVWVVDPNPSEQIQTVSLPIPIIRREEGLLASQAADNLFWLGRYGERLNHCGRTIRALVMQYSNADAIAKSNTTTTKLANLLRRTGAVPPVSRKWQPSRLSAIALTDPERAGSVRRLTGMAHKLALRLRDRLTRDIWRTLAQPFPDIGNAAPDQLIDACNVIVERHAAFVGLAAEGLSHNAAWRFLDLGLALERASLSLQTVRAMVPGSASAQDLSAMLDLFDCLGLYRSRYFSIPTIAAALDMVLLDAAHPRVFAFQLTRIEEHLCALPALRKDGLPERARTEIAALKAEVAASSADNLPPETLDGWQSKLHSLSDTIGRSYFLQQERGSDSTDTRFLA